MSSTKPEVLYTVVYVRGEGYTCVEAGVARHGTKYLYLQGAYGEGEKLRPIGDGVYATCREYGNQSRYYVSKEKALVEINLQKVRAIAYDINSPFIDIHNVNKNNFAKYKENFREALRLLEEINDDDI